MYPFWLLFGGMPTAKAEVEIDSEGGVGKVSVTRVFRHLQIDTGPQRSPSAWSEIFFEKNYAR